HMMQGGGFWKCYDIAATHRPGTRDRGWRSSCFAWNFRQYRITQQSTLLNRRISHQRNCALSTQWHQIKFRAASRQIVKYLVCRDGLSVRDTDLLLHVIRIEIADTPAHDLPGTQQFFERCDSLLKRISSTPV